MVGGICDGLDQLNDLPLKIFKKMRRRNKQRKSCMQMQHRSEFFGLCFFFLLLILSWITAWIQNAKGFVCVLHVEVASILSQQFFLCIRRLRSPAARGRHSSRLFVVPGSSSLLSQRNIPMKSAKNAMRLM